MSRFTDETGREWLVRVDAAKVRRWRDRLGLDLAEMAEDGFQAIVGPSPIRLAEVLYQTCRDQAERVGVSEEAFCELIRNDTWGKAQDAMMEAIIDFFPRRQQREKMMAQLIEARRLMESGNSLPGAPASSASIPESTPSEK